ncbi:MFS transporter [Lactobacillus acidophilus]|uniref:MFS transporter n=1 Tax=Lactobacillus acidophilus TaxID=1579 RepID=UPI000F74F119|nr:MFS transporter [Lactobacillus acidophilus]AZN76642.1 MFS transporter [Lactobacillus acidophilus]
MDEVKDNYIELPTYKVIFMALSVGVIVANMFYIQPIEPLITSSYHISSSTTAVLAMLVQVSYALGLLFLVPLGDAFNRYKFLQVMELISIIALLVAAIAPNFWIFGLAVIIIGLTSIGGQIIIPYIAYLTPVKKQGPILGAMISGMLTGILFARTFSGIIATVLGWHMVYGLAALINLILVIFIHYWVPDDPRKITESKKYSEIIASLPRLFKKYKYLRGSSLNAFCMFGIANLFWSTLAFLLVKYYGYDSAVAGSMGLLGIVSIFAAPFIGRMVDKYSPRTNIQISWWFGVIAYIIFAIFTRSIYMLMIGIVILDLSTQFSQVTNQAIIQSLSRKSNSRNNSIFMFSYFLGGSLGTLIGIDVWGHFGWYGVIVSAVIFLAIALINYFWHGVPKKLK